MGQINTSLVHLGDSFTIIFENIDFGSLLNLNTIILELFVTFVEIVRFHVLLSVDHASLEHTFLEILHLDFFHLVWVEDGELSNLINFSIFKFLFFLGLLFWSFSFLAFSWLFTFSWFLSISFWFLTILSSLSRFLFILKK